MTSELNLLLSLIIFLIIVISKIIVNKKYKNFEKKELYFKTKKIIILLYCMSIFIFIISLIINLISYNNQTDIKTTLTCLVNALSITILVLPFSFDNLYKTSFSDEENYSHIKTIVTKELNDKIIKKFRKAGINVVILTTKKNNLKYKTYSLEEIDTSILRKTVIVSTDEYKNIGNLLPKTNIIYVPDKIESMYYKIHHARGVHDNYIRTIKYLINVYLPLLLSYFLLSILKFPVYYNVLLVLIYKIFTILSSELIYKKLPFDNDLMERKPKDENILFGAQELIFTIASSCFAFFALTIPYMLILAYGGSHKFANTIYLCIFTFINLFLPFSYMNDSFFLKNIFKSLTNLRLIIYIIICLAITIFFNYNSYFFTRNIELQNYIACLGFSILGLSFNELIKLARFTTTKGSKKNEFKNNKKQKRS